MEKVDCVVIGAGVVGLAAARALALQGREVIILEAENAFGTITSARNSEVVHAGIYYPAGSLKARLCVRGRQLLYAHCASHGVAHRRCGKLVVATAPEQLPGAVKYLELVALDVALDEMHGPESIPRGIVVELLHGDLEFLPSRRGIDVHAGRARAR